MSARAHARPGTRRHGLSAVCYVAAPDRPHTLNGLSAWSIGSACAAAGEVRQRTRWNSATVIPSMVGGVRFGLCTWFGFGLRLGLGFGRGLGLGLGLGFGFGFGLCTGPGGTGGIDPRLGRFGPPGTARHRRRSACCKDVCGCGCRWGLHAGGSARAREPHRCTCPRARRWYT